MKIIRIDLDGVQRVVAENVTDKRDAAHRMVRIARLEAMMLPNNPTVEQCGAESIGIFFGIYRHSTYEITE